jgi:hypothetical protein
MAMPFDISRNSTYRGMQAANHAFVQVIRGKRTIALIGGGTGIGKTTDLRINARRHGMKHIPDERPENAASLVQIVWLFRNCEVLSHSECDHLFWNIPSMNVLKRLHEEPRQCALATKEAERNEVFKERGSAQYDPTIAPSRFLVGRNCRQVFTVNENYRDPQVIAKLPRLHWEALVRRGIDPVWVPTDGREGLDLFEYTYHKATDGKMLRSLNYTYDVSRLAINFFVQHADRLLDITPGRLDLIARVFRDTQSRCQRERDLEQMLATELLRPKLKLGSSLVQVLLWPRTKPIPRWKRHQNATRCSAERATEPEPQPGPPKPKPEPANDQPLPEPALSQVDAVTREPIEKYPEAVAAGNGSTLALVVSPANNDAEEIGPTDAATAAIEWLCGPVDGNLIREVCAADGSVPYIEQLPAEVERLEHKYEVIKFRDRSTHKQAQARLHRASFYYRCERAGVTPAPAFAKKSAAWWNWHAECATQVRDLVKEGDSELSC